MIRLGIVCVVLATGLNAAYILPSPRIQLQSSKESQDSQLAALLSSAEDDDIPPYSFAYDIHDRLTGDNKQQEEKSENGVISGQYSLLEPDGTRRIVDYTADPINGFNAVVYKRPNQESQQRNNQGRTLNEPRQTQQQISQVSINSQQLLLQLQQLQQLQQQNENEQIQQQQEQRTQIRVPLYGQNVQAIINGQQLRNQNVAKDMQNVDNKSRTIIIERYNQPVQQQLVQQQQQQQLIQGPVVLRRVLGNGNFNDNERILNSNRQN